MGDCVPHIPYKLFKERLVKLSEPGADALRAIDDLKSDVVQLVAQRDDWMQRAEQAWDEGFREGYNEGYHDGEQS